MKLLEEGSNAQVQDRAVKPSPTGRFVKSKLRWSRVLNVALAAIVMVLLLQWIGRRDSDSVELADAMQKIKSSFVEEVDDRELFEHALEGMVARLDQYSEYLPPETLAGVEEFQTQEFGGIGIQHFKPSVDSPSLVLSPYFNSPAYRAGLRAGDKIFAVDGISTLGLTRTETSKRIRGRPGTPTILTIRHAGEEHPTDVTITREVIVRASVLGDLPQPDGSWDYRLQQDPRIVYLRIETFGKHTADELKQVLSGPAAKPLEAIILDLRGNAGGLLSAAVEVCDLFIDDGTIVTTRGRDGEILERFQATASLLVPNHVPLAVLVNRYSASASEVTAACLQDHGRGVVIGDRTWGKGSVQSILGLKGRGGALKLTTATFWRPSGHNIHRKRHADESEEWGVKPNTGFEIHVSDDEVSELFVQRRERDVVHGLDEVEPDVDSVESNHQAAVGESAATPGQVSEHADEPLEDRVLQRATKYLEEQLRDTGKSDRTTG